MDELAVPDILSPSQVEMLSMYVRRDRRDWDETEGEVIQRIISLAVHFRMLFPQ